jgi:hypothetical protein
MTGPFTTARGAKPVFNRKELKEHKDLLCFFTS